MNGGIRIKNWKHSTFEQRKVISNEIPHNYKLKEIAEALTSISKEGKRKEMYPTFTCPKCGEKLIPENSEFINKK